MHVKTSYTTCPEIVCPKSSSRSQKILPMKPNRTPEQGTTISDEPIYTLLSQICPLISDAESSSNTHIILNISRYSNSTINAFKTPTNPQPNPKQNSTNNQIQYQNHPNVLPPNLLDLLFVISQIIPTILVGHRN